MNFGVPLEIRNHENRVGAVPFVVDALVKRGHQVYVETNAGLKSQYPDEEYEKSGATIVPSPEKLYGQSDIILKVRAPKPVEYDLILPEHIICGYFYFSSNVEMGKSLIGRGCTCLAYDLLEKSNGDRPLVEVEGQLVGQLAIQQGAHYLRLQKGGRGVLLGVVPGVAAAQVVILGASSAGISAAQYAANLGGRIYLLDTDYESLRNARERLPQNVNTLIFHEQNFRTIFPTTDLLVNAIDRYDRDAPMVVTKESVALLPKGAVLVDLEIELGRTIETSKPTSHEHPSLNLDGVTHYCVPNLAGVIPVTASEALSSALLPYTKRLARMSSLEDLSKDKSFTSGIAIYEGHVANAELAALSGMMLYEFDKSPA